MRLLSGAMLVFHRDRHSVVVENVPLEWGEPQRREGQEEPVPFHGGCTPDR